MFLVGFMGAGKTSVGRALGKQLNWLFEDLDARIERREGRTVPDIFRECGEAGFRHAEHMALQEALEELRGGASKVLALGGGAFVQRNNADLLKKSGAPTVFLDAPVEELWQRCLRQASEAGAERPLLRSPEQFRELYQARKKIYQRASLTVSTSARTVDEISAEIAERLALKKVEMRLGKGEVE